MGYSVSAFPRTFQTISFLTQALSLWS